MKPLRSIIMMGVLFTGNAMAWDYSVGIVNLGSGALGGGTAINLFSTSKAGVILIQTYVLDQKDFTGKRASPLILSENPQGNFVYVVYTGLSLPNIVGFRIGPDGLTLEWEHELSTGDVSLQGSTITAGFDYVIEYTYPADPGELFLHVVDESGFESMDDAGPPEGPIWLVTGRVDRRREYYFSCHGPSPSPPAQSVSVYAFRHDVDVDTGSATPVATSTDPAYVQSVCN